MKNRQETYGDFIYSLILAKKTLSSAIVTAQMNNQDEISNFIEQASTKLDEMSDMLMNDMYSKHAKLFDEVPQTIIDATDAPAKEYDLILQKVQSMIQSKRTQSWGESFESVKKDKKVLLN